MKTEVIMKRELFGSEIRQKHQSELLCATDLVYAGNKWRRNNNLPDFDLKGFLLTKQTQEFMAELEARDGVSKITSKGRGAVTWVHPLLFIDIALAISPQLKLEVYGWLMDELCKTRDDSGESYKYMCGVLWVRQKNKREFSTYISDVALKIQRACGVTDWQTASKAQLKLRDDLHKSIATLADALNHNEEAVRIAQKA